MARMLGVDYGTKKIGLAFGVERIVSPYCVIETRGKLHLEEMAVEKLACVIKTENISKVVIGRPGRKFATSKGGLKIDLFADKLREKISPKVKIYFVDESWSSKEGLRDLIKLKVSKKKRKEDHGSAACTILKRWIDWNNA